MVENVFANDLLLLETLAENVFPTRTSDERYK